MRRFLLPLLAVLFFTPISLESDPGPYKATPILKFNNKQEENDYYFRKGRVLIDGGYQGSAVWGKMTALVSGSPEEVWQLFNDSNKWRNYRFPSLKDARIVTAGIAEAVAPSPDVENFYRTLKNQIFSSELGRVKGGRWVNYTFQHFNVPWPVADKWMVVKNTNDETRASEGIYRTEWSKAAGNVKTMEGTLRLEPFEGNRNVTRLEYRALSDPDAHVPRFLLKWGLYRVMPGVVEAIRRQVHGAAIVLDAG